MGLESYLYCIVFCLFGILGVLSLLGTRRGKGYPPKKGLAIIIKRKRIKALMYKDKADIILFYRRCTK